MRTVHHALVLGCALAALAALVSPPARPRDAGPQSSPEPPRASGPRAFVADAAGGRLLHFDDVLVEVDESAVQEIIRSAVPLEGEVGAGFGVRIESAEAAFGDGLALLSLHGEARLVGRAARAAMIVHGGLEAVKLDARSGMLLARVRVFAVDLPASGVLGIDARRLAKALAEGGLERLLGPLQVPVKVLGTAPLPAARQRRARIA